ncbi:MAG TPA: hypothetical protein VHY20_10750, partial [Pirellulales bacterium]|nr:hypothetical protein [Pirellulales bacterium]
MAESSAEQFQTSARAEQQVRWAAAAWALICCLISIAAAPWVEVAATTSRGAPALAAALPAGPFSAITDALRRPPRTPAFPYGL